VVAQFAAQDGDVRELLVAIAKSPAFRTLPPPAPPVTP
jgi:hypothetical protein